MTEQLAEFINTFQSGGDCFRIFRPNKRPIRKSIQVKVSNSAFLTIFTSSAEVYPSEYMGYSHNVNDEGEVMGHLYGTVDVSKSLVTYNVESVSVMQNYYDRGNDYCALSEDHYQKIRFVTDSIEDITCLGRFHSHPYISREFESDYCSSFSETDEESVRDCLDEYDIPPLEIIFALSFLHSAKTRIPKHKNSYLVNYCRNYKYVLRSYIFDTAQDRLRDVDLISCSLAGKKINF